MKFGKWKKLEDGDFIPKGTVERIWWGCGVKRTEVAKYNGEVKAAGTHYRKHVAKSPKWIKHDGSDKCPVDGETEVYFKQGYGKQGPVVAWLLIWKPITHYRIKKKSPR